jgi:hypothetical protein
MPKVRAAGADVLMSAVFEVTYGTAPATGWRRHLMASFASGFKRPLGYEPEIGAGPESQDPYYERMEVQPEFELQARTDSVGFWMRALLGAPVTTGTGPYTHVFSSGNDIPSLSVEETHAQLSPVQYRLIKGLKLGSAEVDLSPDGALRMKFSGIAQSHEVRSTVSSGTPTGFTGAKFQQSNCEVRLDDVAIGQLTSGKFTISNGLEAVETIRADSMIEAADEGERSSEGEIMVRLAANTETVFDTTSAPKALKIVYTLGTITLTLEWARVFFEGAAPSISGPGGISVSRNWRAAKPASGPLCRVTLINSIVSY